MNNNEKFNGNRTRQRRNRSGYYRKRPVKATQAATVNPENKDSENMKKLIEILANKFVVLMEKLRIVLRLCQKKFLMRFRNFIRL